MSREISFRYNLLRGGAYYARLRALESDTPRIRMNRADSIKTALTGTFAPEAEDADGRPMPINFLTDEIQPVLVIDGAPHPLGVFVPTTPTQSEDSGVDRVRVEAYDRCQRVLDTNSARLLYWPRGTLYLDAVEQLLTEAGILTVFKTPSAAAFTEPREDWPAGTPYLDVINELLGEIGYNPLWFDAAGHAILEPASEPEASQIEHTLDASDPDTRVRPGISREVDLFSAPNVFIVTCANPEKSGPMSAEARNENPQSPLSIPRRGRRIVSVTTVNNVTSQAELQNLADQQRNASLISGETIEVSTGLLPGWGVGDVVALHYGDVTALCVEEAYDMELKVGGRMSHTLRKVVYNLE